MKNKGALIIFSAPSGAGKTTLLDYLRDCIPDLMYSISATTRTPRVGEVNGVDYFFMTENEFKQDIESESFAEWEMVHGNYYGTPRKFIDNTRAQGKHIVMDIDVFGKKKLDLIYPDAVGVLILPPGLPELEVRLRKRKSDSEDAIQRRMTNASIEMNFALREGKYEYRIINESLDKAKKETLTIVQEIINRPYR